MAESSIDISMVTNSEMEGVPSSQPPSNSDGATQQTPEELVGRAIAPIKREFLRPPPPSRTTQNDAASDANSSANAKQSQSSLVKEKKSKRQLKRERLQVPKFST